MALQFAHAYTDPVTLQEAIPDLAPGDFATVKRQAEMLGEQLSPQAWLEQLSTEAKAKMAGLRRQKLGFAA